MALATGHCAISGASCVPAAARGYAGRLGGEEFGILVDAVDIRGATGVARRIQACIAEFPLIEHEQRIELTVSIGITLVTAADASAEAPLSRSDLALYRAKKGGRNRIES